MNEYVKGLMKAVQLTRADMYVAQREHDAAVQELLSELDKCARGVVSEGAKSDACSGTPSTCVCDGCSKWRAFRAFLYTPEDEKGRVGIGPHTSPRDSHGCTCHWHQQACPGTCPLAQPATRHATQPTQVLGNTAYDATSHG